MKDQHEREDGKIRILPKYLTNAKTILANYANVCAQELLIGVPALK
ncbi:10476_t:CDS:2 [Entrophospora sp. SA101]|nr:10476_t:CDS:2 [Entrophospora sp. SA101]